MNKLELSTPRNNRAIPFAILGVFAFALTLALGFAPTAGAITPSCPTTISLPAGSYTYGSTVSASFTVACTGSGTWMIQTEPVISTVASGTFTCPCSSTSLFSYVAGSAPLTSGNYVVTVIFGATTYKSPTISVSEFTVTNELPLGAITAAGVAFAGLLVTRRLSKSFSIAVPTK
jgi:hypothetical protein